MQKRIKVLFIFGALGGGGAQRQFCHLINNIDTKKIFPILLSIGKRKEETVAFYKSNSDDEINQDSELRKKDFEYYYIFRKLKNKEEIHFISRTNNSLFKIQIKIYKLIKQITPDITISISPFSTVISILPIVLNRVKWRIQSVRSNEMLFEHNRSFSNFLIWAIQFLISGYIVNSFDLKKKMLSNGYSRKMIHVIYNGIPVYHAPKERSKISKRITIAFIARLHEVKNHLMFFNALSNISVTKKIQVLIYGTGHLEQKLKKYVVEFGIADIVSFRGWKSNIGTVLQNLDIVVLTSNGEGFNNSISEAQIHGIPVVTTNCTGSAEIVENGVTGFVVPVGDVQSFAVKLKILIEDDMCRYQFSRNAYIRSRSMFNMDKMIRNYESFFSQLEAAK